MKGTQQTALATLRIATVCFAFFCVVSSRADSWLPPHEFDTLSENGKFVAHVIPRKKDSKPLLIVSAVNTGKTNELWRTDLSNRVSPVEVLISDDGASAITLDNWGGIGYGDDVVAIYNRHGQLAKYSLEQIAPPPKPKPDVPAWLSDRQAYEGKFSHSTSSRHWRENSIEFFLHDAGQLLFCIWLDWENQWVAWRTSDGQMIKLTGDPAKRFNIEGRRRALEEAKSGHFAPAALNFLGRLRFKEDRPLIERWLKDSEFSTGTSETTIYSNGKPITSFSYTSQSYRRATADRILARWDSLKSSEDSFGFPNDYHFLGTLKCSVSFPTAPRKKQGTIRLYLIPVTTQLDQWFKSRPDHYLVADLEDLYPYVFENGRSTDGQVGNVVNFIIYGVTPGKYQLKAVWDKSAPFAKENEIVCQPRAGDYESATSPLIIIRKGITTENVRIDCKKLATE